MTGKQIQLVAQGGFAASPLLHGPCLAYAPTTPVGDPGGGGGGPGDLDHWAWIVPTGTQSNGTPFDITLIAQDASNNTVTFYSGSATISMGADNQIHDADVGLDSGIPDLVVLSAGVWTGTVTINAVGGVHTDILSFNAVDTATGLVTGDSPDISVSGVGY